PLPFAADDHQTKNAQALERQSAAKLVQDKELDGQKLFDTIVQLAGAAGALESMGMAARQFARPGAARRAAEIFEEVACQ
ncbi:MAG: glycosyltransferase, partial [Terriglobia bacterium]